MYWINVKGRFITDNPDLFLHNLKLLMEQVKTTFSGEITQQLIRDIPCKAIKVESEKSELTEAVKVTELSENTDDSVNEEVMEGKIINNE